MSIRQPTLKLRALPLKNAALVWAQASGGIEQQISGRASRRRSPHEYLATQQTIARSICKDKHFVYNPSMIQTFANAETESFFTTGILCRLSLLKSSSARQSTQSAPCRDQIEDLRLPPSNYLEALFGNRAGQWSVRINQQWRVSFSLRKWQCI